MPRCQLIRLPTKNHKGRGRRPIKGKPLKKLSPVVKDRKVSWTRYRVSLWYGRTNRLVEIASRTAVWYRGGVPPVPIRWLLVRDPKGELVETPECSSPPIPAWPQRILAEPSPKCRPTRPWSMASYGQAERLRGLCRLLHGRSAGLPSPRISWSRSGTMCHAIVARDHKNAAAERLIIKLHQNRRQSNV